MDMEDRYSWEDRRRYQEEVEYYDWCRSMGPRNIGMGPPPLFGPPAMIGARPPPPHLVCEYNRIFFYKVFIYIILDEVWTWWYETSNA